MKKNALISVTDKTQLDVLADFLVANGYDLISSSGTKSYLESCGHKVISVESLTSNPEAFDGRMKTISYQIGSGLLFDRDNSKHCQEANDLNITPIDLVVCNLYDFSAASSVTTDLSLLIEKIDVGGPTMLRAAAKNYKHVSVLSSIEDYDFFMENFSSLSESHRLYLSQKTFSRLSEYDRLISETFAKINGSGKLRYGENPHQDALVISLNENSLASLKPLQGKELSYNNLLDSHGALETLFDVQRVLDAHAKKQYCSIIVKHSNPCGVSLSDNKFLSLERAWNGDPISAFGSIVSMNYLVDEKIAQFLCEHFVEVVIAPGFTDNALDIFSKKKNIRLLDTSLLDWNLFSQAKKRSIHGGYLVQNADLNYMSNVDSVVGNDLTLKDSLFCHFAMAVTKNLKSNAIGLFNKSDNDCFLVGAGMGNPNRLISTLQAIDKAKENNVDLSQVLMVSDAFFPFPDNVELANSHGIKVIIQPGGSIKDNDVFNTCERLGVSMGITGTRNFNH